MILVSFVTRTYLFRHMSATLHPSATISYGSCMYCIAHCCSRLLKSVVCVLVHTHLDYCNSILSKASQLLVCSLQSVLHAAGCCSRCAQTAIPIECDTAQAWLAALVSWAGDVRTMHNDLQMPSLCASAQSYLINQYVYSSGYCYGTCSLAVWFIWTYADSTHKPGDCRMVWFYYAYSAAWGVSNTTSVMPKNRPGPAGTYKLCHMCLKRL